MKNIHLHHTDNLKIMSTLPDESIDIICIDPPYLYLKNQKLERVFDEHKFFSECKRLLTKNGFIVMFGRGESFYRWNTMLADLGFVFKEEIVWNKSHCTSPLMNLSRVHETIAIFTKAKGTINKVKVPYMEMKSHDVAAVIADVKRIRSILKNPKSLEAVQRFLENNVHINSSERVQGTNVSVQPSKLFNKDRSAAVMDCLNNGLNEKSIIKADFYKSEAFAKSGVTTDIHSAGDRDRCVKVLNSFEVGMNEKSIIKQIRDHYSAIHPTQKPVRLLERLLNLVLPKGKEEITVADFFAGSMSTMEAVINLQEQNPDKIFKGIATEIDEEYFEAGRARINKLNNSTTQKLQPCT